MFDRPCLAFALEACLRPTPPETGYEPEEQKRLKTDRSGGTGINSNPVNVVCFVVGAARYGRRG